MDKEKLITYLMHTPHNTNLAVLRSLAGEENEKLETYVMTTPGNMNRAVLESLLSTMDGSNPVVGKAVVGKAKIQG